MSDTKPEAIVEGKTGKVLSNKTGVPMVVRRHGTGSYEVILNPTWWQRVKVWALNKVAH